MEKKDCSEFFDCKDSSNRVRKNPRCAKVQPRIEEEECGEREGGACRMRALRHRAEEPRETCKERRELQVCLRAARGAAAALG